MEKKRDKYGVFEEEDLSVCSATDCTGLIPAGIVSEAEREAYQDLYPFLTTAEAADRDLPSGHKKA